MKTSYALLYPLFLFLRVAQHITRIQKHSLCSWITVVTITVQYTVQLSKEN